MRVVVGRIGRPHGIRGEVTVEPRTDEPEVRFAPGAVLLVDHPRKTLVVESLHWHSGRILLAFEGVETRNEAEELRNVLLEIERDADETPDDPDEYYDSALIDCAVHLADGAAIGTVIDVIHLPSQELLSVQTLDGREVLIPFVGEIVPTVDIRGRRITITPPPGLLDD